MIGFLFLVGCDLANTPTAQVEEYLSKYQRLDNEISLDESFLIEEKDLDVSLKTKYQELLKKQYRNLSYEIKEEIIDGDNATVTTSIEVIDYKDILNKYSKNEYTTEKYHELIIKDLKDAKNKVTYTIDFTLTKDNKDNWHIDNLTNEIKEKMLGIN